MLAAATHVVVRHAPARFAGVAGGLQQTAMNVGPVLGVAAATLLMGHAGIRSPLVVLAVAAAGAVPLCRALPDRSRPAPGGLPADTIAGPRADSPAGPRADSPAGLRADTPAGLPGDAPAGLPADAPSDVLAGHSDAERTRPGVERGPFTPSLGDHEV